MEHAPALAEGEPGSVRVRLLAGRFGPAVTSVVLWLIEFGLDIGCIELRLRKVTEGQAILVSRQILPPPEAGDFLVRRRRREEAEDEKEARTRTRNAVTVINEHGSVPAGTELSLDPNAFSEDQRAAIEQKIAEDENYGKAVWTGRGSRHAIEWRLDGATYSPSGLVWDMLAALNLSPGGIRGPLYWRLPDGGRTLAEEAETLLISESAEDGDASGKKGEGQEPAGHFEQETNGKPAEGSA